jgi:signal transduction histidine kinase
MTWATTSLTGAIMMVWIAGYLKLSVSQAVLGYALMVPTIGVGSVIGAYRFRDTARTLMRWQRLRGETSAAPGTWDAAVRAMPRGIATAYVGGLIGCVAAAAAMVAVWHEPAYVGPALWAALATGGGAALVICVFGAELVVRPLVADVVRYLPPDYVPATGLKLRTKALAPLPVVALFGALTVGAFVSGRTSGSLRLVIAIGIALATIVVATIVFLVVTRSALDPLDELVAGTERVREGDLTTPVPILTSDDFGLLTVSFNRMLEGLRERESLREHNVELATKLHESLVRVVAAGDAERRRVERDLHDGAQQHLVLISLKLGALERAVATDQEQAIKLVEEVRADLQAALVELRDLARGIYPSLLESDGLRGAVQEAAQRAAVPANVDCDGIRRYAPELETAVYFCCSEALQNAAKHAGDGAGVTVSIAERDQSLEFEISDDGRGFDPASVSPNSGLQNIADRIGALGGTVRIRSAPGEGTTITGSVTLAGETDAAATRRSL